MVDDSYYFKNKVAEFYDVTEQYTKDIPFYKKYIADNTYFLELGIGTGRVAIELAKEGAKITGIDLSPKMLSFAEKKIEKESLTEKIQLKHEDMTNFSLNKKDYDVAYIPYYSFCNLENISEQEGCLSSVHKHLKDDGTLIIHLFQPRTAYLSSHLKGGIGGPIVEDSGNYLLSNGNTLSVQSSTIYDHSRQVHESNIIYEEIAKSGETKKYITPLSVRLFYRYEMELLLKYNGFELENLFGDFDESPLTDESWEMIFIAKKVKKAEKS